MFEAFLASIWVIYVLLAVLILEAALLFRLWKVKSVGLPPLQVISFLGAGIAFSLALAVVVADAHRFLLGICLIFAFIFHILDLKLRWHIRS